MITCFPSTQESSASRQIVKTAYLNLIPFSLLIMSTSPEAHGLLRTWWHTDRVRISFESLWNRVQAQNSTLCPPAVRPKSLLHARHSQGRRLLVLDADVPPVPAKPARARWPVFPSSLGDRERGSLRGPLHL